MAATAREFDPNRKYNVVLSERLKNGGGGGYSLNSVQVDADLKLPAKVTSSKITRSGYNDDEWDLQLKGSKEGESQVLSGLKQPTTSYALAFDAATQTFTLDRIDNEYAFGNDQSGDGSQSDDGMLNALIEQEGEADPENPYDWRHHVTRRRTSSPELEQYDPFRLDAIGSPSPERRRESHRQASTPPGEVSAQSSPKMDSEPESEQSDAGIELEIEKEPPRRPARQDYDEDAESDASSETFGLQIIEEGSTRKIYNRTRGRDILKTLDGPTSLRSVTTSRSPGMRQEPQQSSSEDEEVDNDDVDEINIGSPVHPKAPQPDALAQDDMDMDEEGFEDLELELEKEFADGGDGEDDYDDEPNGTPGGVPVPMGVYVEASSSESEAD